MISHCKRLLGVLEVLGLVSGGFCLLFVGLSYAGLIRPHSLAVLVIPAMLVAFAVSFTGILLVNEYSRFVRAGRSWWQQARGLSWAEMVQVSTWSPVWLKWAVPFVLAATVVSMYPNRRVSWTPGEPFEERHFGLIVGPTLVISLFLPVLASARRMSGSYSESLPQAPPHDA
jgi:hypothetical protein